jgi:hypothetical protein
MVINAKITCERSGIKIQDIKRSWELFWFIKTSLKVENKCFKDSLCEKKIGS